jgi:hypothetical protein
LQDEEETVLQGKSVRISPSWITVVTIIDLQWDTNVLSGPDPRGKWWGDLALLGGTGSNEGEWQWIMSQPQLQLWVPVPGSVPGHRRLVASLDQFTLPATSGASGTGALQPGLAPTFATLSFDWQVP